MSTFDEDGVESRCSLDSKRQSMAPPDSLQADCGAFPGLCLVINNETVRIRAISIKITGLELKQSATKQPAAVEVNLTAAEGASLYAEQMPTGKKKKKESILSKIIKGRKARHDSTDKKSTGAAVATVSGSSADGSAGLTEPVSQNRTPVPQQQCDQQQVSSELDAPKGNEENGRFSSDSSEISIPPRDGGKAREAAAIATVAAAAAAAAATTATRAAEHNRQYASNTIESETGGETSASEAPPVSEKPKPSSNKKLATFLNRKKLRGSTDQLLCTSNFPHDVPENVKSLFQIIPSTRLIATVYTSNAGRTQAVKKQKALMMEGDKIKRFTVDGKSRSVWLDPPPGEKVEIWIEYFGGDNGECNRALGRLPDTDKYGYILPDEIDPEGESLTREEKEEYKYMLEKLAMFQYVYGNDDDEKYM